MIIRKAAFEDLEAINKIYNQAVDSKSTADMAHCNIDNRIKWFEQHNSETYPIFVGKIDGRVVGWVSLSAYRPGRFALRHTAEISYYVHNDYQRQGIGFQLTKCAINMAHKYEFNNLFAIILEHNIGSIKLMEKLKFKLWGFLPEVANFNGAIQGHVYYGLKIETS